MAQAYLKRLVSVSLIVLVLYIGVMSGHMYVVGWLVSALGIYEWHRPLSEAVTKFENKNPLSAGPAIKVDPDAPGYVAGKSQSEKRLYLLMHVLITIFVSACGSYYGMSGLLTGHTIAMVFLIIQTLVYLVSHLNDDVNKYSHVHKNRHNTKVTEVIFHRFCISVVGHWCVSFLWNHCVVIFHAGQLPLVVYTIFVTGIGENGALACGILWGRRRVFRALSPNKSLEGCVGQLVTSMMAGVAFRAFIEDTYLFPSVLHAVGSGLVIGVAALIGDLVESFVKRSFDIKDMGSLLPGTGGMLDRIDGQMLSFPAMFWYWYYFIATNDATRLS